MTVRQQWVENLRLPEDSAACTTNVLFTHHPFRTDWPDHPLHFHRILIIFPSIDYNFRYTNQ